MVCATRLLWQAQAATKHRLHAALNMSHMPCWMLSLQAAADVLAMASLEVDLSGIQEGEVSNSPLQ